MEQLRGESNFEFEQRKKFYDFLSSKKDIKNNEIEKISKIWSNIKFRSCRYSPKMYHFIMSLDKQFNK